MEKVFLKLCIMVLAVIGSVQFVYADGGKKALDSEVNARFEALEAASGGGSGLKVYNADNEYLGDLVNMGIVIFSLHPITIYNPTMEKFINLEGDGVVSNAGTKTYIDRLVYKSDDCSGQPYIDGTNPLIYYFVHAHREGGDTASYYVTGSFETQKIMVGSRESLRTTADGLKYLFCGEEETPYEENVRLAVSVELPFNIVRGELQFK